MILPLLLAAACPPQVALDGDPGLTGAIHARGLEPLRADCPTVHVHVQTSSGAWTLTRMEPSGPGERRVLHDAGAAVALVDSWARADLWTEGLPLPPPAIKIKAASKNEAPSFHFNASAELGLDSSGAFNTGGRAELAWARHRVQPWLSARGSYSPAHANGQRSPVQRAGLELTLGVAVPIRFSNSALHFSIGVGPSWTQHRRAFPNDCPALPCTAALPAAYADNFTANTFLWGAEAGAQFSHRLSSNLLLTVAASARALPFGREPLVPRYAATLSEVDRGLLSLDPPAALVARLGLGLTWEAF